jgi:hypothetical protein
MALQTPSEIGPLHGLHWGSECARGGGSGTCAICKSRQKESHECRAQKKNAMQTKNKNKNKNKTKDNGKPASYRSLPATRIHCSDGSARVPPQRSREIRLNGRYYVGVTYTVRRAVMETFNPCGAQFV